MLSLTQIKRELGFGISETQYDPDLARYIRQVHDLIRDETHRDIAWRVSNIKKINATTVELECFGHGLTTGDTILLAGTDSTPTTDGEFVVTVTTADALRITTVDLTKSGEDAALHVQKIRKFVVDDSNEVWLPQMALPFDSITELAVFVDDAWTVVDPVDYELSGDLRYKKSVSLVWTGDGTATDDGEGNTYYTGSSWPLIGVFPRGQYALRQLSSQKNMRVTYWAGLRVVPEALRMAAESLVLDLFESAGGPKDIASVSEEGVSSTRMSGQERKEHKLSADHVIESWRARL